jgi:hypothetical protein
MLCLQRKPVKKIVKKVAEFTIEEPDFGGEEPAKPAEKPKATKEDVEKKIKIVSKKLRQVEALKEKISKGEKLTPEEEDKLKKKPDWEKELKELQSQL